MKQQREILLQAFDAAIARCQAGSVLARHLPPVPDSGRLVILAAGKGAGPMAEAAEQFYAEALASGQISGIVVVPHGVNASLDVLETRHASHPVPDECSEAAAREMLRDQVQNALAALTDREREVLELRYGLLDGKDHTLEEVGKYFNVTRERIRQIEAKALRKLRHPTRSHQLREYLGG